nr:MAG TPA: hypothetical protein [Caudoviricetes sp.]
MRIWRVWKQRSRFPDFFPIYFLFSSRDFSETASYPPYPP